MSCHFWKHVHTAVQAHACTKAHEHYENIAFYLSLGDAQGNIITEN